MDYGGSLEPSTRGFGNFIHGRINERGDEFGHARILADGVERARAKLEYTPLGTAFRAPEFTVAELRGGVYEIGWGLAPDPRNFHRKVTGVGELLEPTGETTTRNGRRPAALFRRGPATALHPPLIRG